MAALIADSTIGDFPAFDGKHPITGQAKARLAIADEISTKSGQWNQSFAERWTKQPPETVKRAQALLSESDPLLDSLSGTPLDSRANRSRSGTDSSPRPDQHMDCGNLQGYLADRWQVVRVRLFSAQRARTRSPGLLRPHTGSRKCLTLEVISCRASGPSQAICAVRTDNWREAARMPTDQIIADTLSGARSLLDLLSSIQNAPELAIRALLLDVLARPERQKPAP